MEKHELLQESEIVQLHPINVGNKAFAGCLMVITQVKPWGAQGYVQGIGENRDDPGGQYYYRAKWDEMELTGGMAVFMSR